MIRPGENEQFDEDNRAEHAFLPVIGYLFDLDGTVYRGEKLLPGASKTIAALRDRGRRLLFVSNKPLHSRRHYAQKLTKLGIPTSEEHVLSSSYVLARCLATRSPGARVFAIGEPPLVEELRNAGLELCDDPARTQYVIAAFDRTLTYAKLNTAFQALRAGAHFVATNADRTCPIEGGEIPDAAAVIAALESTAEKKVEHVFGKPSPEVIHVALERLRVPATRCVMVGDRLETDMIMAKQNELVAVLTLTGVTTPSMLKAASLQPDYVVGDLRELPALDCLLAPLLAGRQALPAGRLYRSQSRPRQREE